MSLKLLNRVLGFCVLLTILASCVDLDHADNASSRLRWFQDARFGMFIHWGVYSLLGSGEWVMYQRQIQVPEYEKLPPQFSPTKFNAREWVALAKAAGQKYITVTTKHHDGFCMFHSKLTTYNSFDATPAKRDFIAELTQECHRQGIRICYYYSLLDWHHPDYLPRRPWEKETRPADKSDFDRYVAYAHGQLRELCTNYGRVDGIWFDGGWEHSAKEWQSEKLVRMIRSLQPHIIINDRSGIPEDFGTPEQFVPQGGTPKGRAWETCMTINGSWGYNKDDHGYKSVTELVHLLADVAGKGGNFLLNVGPKPDGTIQPEFAERLHAVGDWLKTKGESIYGTVAGPFRALPFGACTREGNRLYFHILKWPRNGELKIDGLKNEVKSARLLRGIRCEVHRSPETVEVQLPAKSPDPMDTVVVVRVKGKPKVENLLRQNAEGFLNLTAALAEVHGETARYESGDGKDNIGYWMNPQDWVSWDCVLDREGKYRVEVTYACDKGVGGSEVRVVIAKHELPLTVRDTGSWSDFIKTGLGEIELHPGQFRVEVRPTKMPHGAVMNLQKIELKPTPR